MRGDREEILREPVVDLACDAGALLRDRTAELRRADRPPGADEHQREGEEAQVVTGGDVHRPARRGEHEVERREEQKREAQREPPREIVPRLREHSAPADNGEEVEQRLHRERGREPGRSGGHARQRRQRRQRAAVGAKEQPHGGERDRGREDGVAERAIAKTAAAADERSEGDEALAGDAAREGGPRVGATEGAAAERRDDAEGRGGQRPDQEARREQQVGAQAYDGEARAREQRDEDAGERHDRL